LLFNGGIYKAELYADFKSVEKVAKNPLKKLWSSFSTFITVCQSFGSRFCL
jgi:hypothetical protein